MKTIGMIILLGILSVTSFIASSLNEVFPAVFADWQERGEMAEIVAVVKEQMRAFEAEDITAVDLTIHPASRARDATLAIAAQIFRDLEGIKYTLHPDYAYFGNGVIELKQTTTGPPPFRNNMVLGKWQFEKDKGTWKLFDSEVMEIVYLDEVEDE